MSKKRLRYQIMLCGEWIACSHAVELPKGWLDYRLRDGTVGLARPGRWRQRP